MIDHHQHVCHRMQAAQSTGDRYAVERSWCVAPDEPKVPAVVWQAMGWIAGFGVLFVLLPSLVKMVMA